MNNARYILTAVLLTVFVFGMAASTLAEAQATRTWVSGVGDDVNPCSRTAPCKTFAGAISKTATGGEISVLDPGGYGAVTITKSITIDGSQGGGWGSILNAGVNGIIVNALGAAGDPAPVVTLRNLSINGAGTGTNGIRILAATTVFVENCQIFGNAGRGITDERTAPGFLLVDNTIVRDNAQSGIVIVNPAGTSNVEASIKNSQISGNGVSGVVAESGARVTLHNSVASGHANFGAYANQLSGLTYLFVGDTTLSENGVGLQVGAGTPVILLSNATITNNVTGMALGSALAFSFGNNKVAGNNAGNSGFSLNPVPLQ